MCSARCEIVSFKSLSFIISADLSDLDAARCVSASAAQSDTSSQRKKQFYSCLTVSDLDFFFHIDAAFTFHSWLPVSHQAARG